MIDRFKIEPLSDGRFRVPQVRIRNKQRTPQGTFNTRSEAGAFIFKLTQEIEAKTFVAAKAVWLFKDLADDWMQNIIIDSGLARITIAGYQRQVEIWKLIFHELKCDAFEYSHFVNARKRLILPVKKGGFGLENPDLLKPILKRILRHGVRIKAGVRSDVFELMTSDTKKKGQERKRSRPIDPNEVLNPKELKLLVMATEPDHELLVAVLSYSGARIDEALALQARHINPLNKHGQVKTGYIRIEQSLSTAKIRGAANQPKWTFGPPKSKAGDRDIPVLDKALIKNLTELKATMADDELLFRTKAPMVRQLVITTDDRPKKLSVYGEPITDRKTYANEVIHRARKRAGIEKFCSPHHLRHGYGSMVFDMSKLDVNSTLARVKTLLGHESLQTTMDIYLHYIEKYEKPENVLADEYEEYAARFI
jgi:integrase